MNLTRAPRCAHLVLLLTALAVSLPAAAQRTTMPLRGVNVHVASGPEMGLVDLMNLNRVRIDVAWNSIESTPGVFDWRDVDRAFDAALSRRLGIYANLGSVPDWACRPGSKGASCVPDGSERWKAFVRAAATRYRGLVEYWGVGNEPNLRQFWQGDALEYVAILLVPAGEAIREADPAVRISAPDLSSSLKATIPIYAFFDAIANAKAAPYVDAVSVHLYEDKSPVWPCPSFEGPQGLHDLLFGGSVCTRSMAYYIDRSTVADRPILVTEFGYAGGGDAGTKVRETFDIFLPEARVSGVYFYELQDNSGVTLGLLREDGSPKGGAYDLALRLSRGDEPPAPVFKDTFEAPWGASTRWVFPHGGAVVRNGGLENSVQDFVGKVGDAALEDFDIASSIAVRSDLGNPWNWAGLIGRTTKPEDGFKDSGYLAFVRSNGDVGLFRAPDTRIGYAVTGLDPKKRPVNLMLRAKGTVISVHVDGQEVIAVDDRKWTSGYAGVQDNSLARHDDVWLVRN